MFLGWMLIKMAIENEKGDFVKMSVSFIRNAHVARSGACFWKSKSIKNDSKNGKDFRKYF